jgi:hypothetical protein
MTVSFASGFGVMYNRIEVLSETAMCRSVRKRFLLKRWLKPQRPFIAHGSGKYLLATGLVVASLGWMMWDAYRIGRGLIAPSSEIMAVSPERLSQQVLKQEIREVVQGYPIERMSGYIARQDRVVAAYLVSIAKKESNWGKRAPRYDGRDCYNYWGYRDPNNTQGTGGHTCFQSPQEAVEAVGKRIHRLVYEEDRQTPAKMIVWKCGYSCDGHSEESVQKWKQDVGYYFRQFVK